ncbi:DUF4280 domain-containing protein [Francisellaceae bacterium]|nr:DUF4280 domain-containing protein [Francisellaceae bacterium]
MSKNVVNNAMCKCIFGLAPSPLGIMQMPKPIGVNNNQLATANDHVPITNIRPFGLCSSPSNPTVIAALGVPQPCIPVTAAPWVNPSAKVKQSNVPVLTQNSKLLCAWGGLISILQPGQAIADTKG